MERDRIEEILEGAKSAIFSAQSAEALESVKITYMGRKGVVAQLFKEMSSVAPSERPAFGAKINSLKSILDKEIALRERSEHFGRTSGPKSRIDVTMPGIACDRGVFHPITKTIADISKVFYHMGFSVVEGPEIETEFNNFDALNIPTDHPSRDGFDTFYIKNEWLLRSHTSPVQIRYMRENAAPFAIVVPGKVFRPDAVDASHSFMFHQIEGLMVSEKVSFANLKWILYEFAKKFFGDDVKLRFRPHFFPFTEPSAEVDVSCLICGGDGCRVCSHKGWLEILGAGMVDPNVFKAVGLNPQKVSGLAFGMGIERIAMLKYGIDDIRLFFENDIRFLKQF
ncbi:MAG: phenylalanine--tRNA ligase subunit alpha [Candidatus Omnitrophota bacterium]